MKVKKYLFSLFLLSGLLVGCNFGLAKESSEQKSSSAALSSETSITTEETSSPSEEVSEDISEDVSEDVSSESSDVTEESTSTPSLPSEDAEMYFLAFWLDEFSGTPYAEYELAKGTLITFPAPPTRADYTFDGWYLEDSRVPFAEYTPISDDTDLYAKWQSDLATDGKFALVGDLKNSNLSSVNWETDSPDGFLNLSGDIGFYEITLELGYGAEFKIRETGLGWDGIVLDYHNINEGDRTSYISESGEFGGNIHINSAGTYFIEAAPSDGYLYIEIISTDVSEGVVIEDLPLLAGLRLIGDLNDAESTVTWDVAPYDESALFDKVSDYVFTKEVNINADGAFKIKEPGLDWDEGIEVNYGNIWVNDRKAFIAMGEHSNIVINTDGRYLLTVTVRAVPRLVIEQI